MLVRQVFYKRLKLSGLNRKLTVKISTFIFILINVSVILLFVTVPILSKNVSAYPICIYTANIR